MIKEPYSTKTQNIDKAKTNSKEGNPYNAEGFTITVYTNNFKINHKILIGLGIRLQYCFISMSLDTPQAILQVA